MICDLINDSVLWWLVSNHVSVWLVIQKTLGKIVMRDGIEVILYYCIETDITASWNEISECCYLTPVLCAMYSMPNPFFQIRRVFQRLSFH